MGKDVCSQCEVFSQESFDADAVLKELSRYFISREDVRGEIEGAKDEEAFKTLCNLCRAYQVASTYYHRKLNVPSLHNDPNDMGTWDDLSKFAVGIHRRSHRLTRIITFLKVADIVYHSVSRGAEAIEKSRCMSDNVRLYKILFSLLFLDRQGRNTSKMERDIIRDWGKQFSIRELAFIADRSTATIHDIVG